MKCCLKILKLIAKQKINFIKMLLEKKDLTPDFFKSAQKIAAEA